MNEQQRPVALITGAAKRVGAQIARSLHGAGYDLALHYRHSRGEMDALCAELNMARNGSARAIQAELADVEVMPRIVDDCIARFGRLDALVNNASAFYATPVGSVTPTQWEELFASNARAPFFLAQAAAPHLQAARGAIVNMADIYAERPLPGHAVYCMAKAALVMMTLALAQGTRAGGARQCHRAGCRAVAGIRQGVCGSEGACRAHAAQARGFT
jgi:pteridine reductase